MKEYRPEDAASFEFASREVLDSGALRFVYRVVFLDGEAMEFEEVVRLSDAAWRKKVPEAFASAMLEDLHLLLGISYYKLFCPPEFHTDIKLSVSQAAFWNTVYTDGLGEFAYRNALDVSRFAVFLGDEEYERGAVKVPVDEGKVLVGIGGGKDSAVSLELLSGYERTGFVLETGRENPIAREVAEVAGVPLQVVSRTLDPKVIAGVPGSYGGHIPVSLIYAFLGVIEAAIAGQGYVAVSNEQSANVGNVVVDGREVNHAWSKTSEAEELMQEYVREHLVSSARYFSLLRPFYELRVVQMMVERGRKYFQTFSSCNRNFAHEESQKRWCGECAKCASAFLLFSAFLEQEELLDVFGENLFDKEELLPLFRDLLGFGDAKPFDCVGTFEESRTALALALPRWSDTLVAEEFGAMVGVDEVDVLKTVQAPTVPSGFRFLGMKSVLILGYGREGHASKEYIERTYPEVRVAVADQSDGEGYLEKQEEFDLVIKTPVIPALSVTRPFTTATDIFFSLIPREQVIGVTGSKGKSTTATLLFEMLRVAGKKARLVGNIGVPALLSIMEQAPEAGELFVFELSSYQLADMDVSPHVAAVTTLFPEHLDYHESLSKYFSAKENIVRFQEEGDFFFYVPGGSKYSKELERWEVRAEVRAVSPLPFAVENSSLRGEHNRLNAGLAYAVAAHFGVSEDAAKKAIEGFAGLPHRLQFVGVFKGVEFYDDAISTTPDSAIAALRAIPGVHTIILGGQDRGFDFSSLEDELREQRVSVVVLLPGGEEMLSSREGFEVLEAGSMEEAVRACFLKTPEGKVCLLSPAAPSYNLFKNFEDRGEQFGEAVRKFGG